MDPIVFGDLEVALADHLTTALAERDADAPVFNAVPAQRPKRFVRLAHVGGTQSNLITDRPRIVAECWDTVGVYASDLARLVRALITSVAPGYIGGIWVDKVIDMGVSFSPIGDLPRYLVVGEFHVAGTVLA